MSSNAECFTKWHVDFSRRYAAMLHRLELPIGVPMSIIIEYVVYDRNAYAAAVFSKPMSGDPSWEIFWRSADYVCIIAPFALRRRLDDRSVGIHMSRLDDTMELAASIDVGRLDCATHIFLNHGNALQPGNDNRIAHAAEIRKYLCANGTQFPVLAAELTATIDSACKRFANVMLADAPHAQP